MLSKFFPALKPKDYSVQIMKDSTSQSAVQRIKRTRTTAPLKKLATLALVLSFVGGGLASATAATAVTAKQAQANILADQLCISSDPKKAGNWNSGVSLYGIIGGRAQYAMQEESTGSRTVPSDAAYSGFSGSWGGNGAPDKGEFLTAYEKYGVLYPQYDAWVPVFGDKEVVVKQVDSSQGSYSTADGKLTTKAGDGNKLQPGESPLTTSSFGSCLGFVPSVSAGISNLISVLPRFVMGVSLELYGAAYGSGMTQPDSVLYSLGKNIDKFITQPGGLKDSLFIPFIMVVLLIGACWVGYVGIVKRAATQALQSTGWMILSIALGTVFLAQPTLISSFVDDTVNQVQVIVNESVLSNSGSQDMCKLDGSGYKVTVRETKCTIWHSTIYTTWVAGQFGEGASSVSGDGSILKQEAGRNVLGNEEYKIHYGSNAKNHKVAETWPQFMVDRQVTNKKLELSEVAWAQLSGADKAVINRDWAGNIGMISSAILMFFGAGASSAVLLVYGFSLLVYQLMMISAVLMSPFFFLFGIIPNWGRRILMRYAELITSLAVKRIITAFMLAMYLLFYNLVIGDAALGMLLLKMIVIFCLAIFFITSRGKFVKMFADNINFGGNKSVGLPGNKAVAVAAGLGVGLVGGGLIGGAVVAHKTRKDNKDTEGNINTMKIEGSPTADIKTPPRGPNTGSGGPNTGGGGNAGGSGGSGGAGAVGGATKAIKTVAQVGGTINDVQEIAKGAGQVKSWANNLNGSGAPTQPQTMPSGTVPPPTAAGASQGATAGTAGTAATVGAGAGARVAPTAAKTAGSFASGASGAGAAAPTAAGAAATSSGVSAAGAAAGSGVAAGGAAAATAGGTVAAGASAGSVVPVVGTAAGAAAAAIAVNIAKKKSEGNNGGGN